MTESYLRQQKVISHCWSPDGTHIAISLRNSNIVEIYKVGTLEKIGTWQKIHSFKDSSQQVNVLGWSINNKILTGSDDRSVFVYRNNNDQWTKDLVVCRNEKAIVCGDWSLNGEKCVVGSACHHAYILFYDKKNNWWSDLQIGGFYSSITSTKFHPSGRVVGLGSADQSFKIVSCVIEDQGKISLEFEDTSYQGPFSNVTSFGQILVQIGSNGWVNAIDFSPSGNQLAISVHTGQIRNYKLGVDGNVNEENVTNIKEAKPFTKLLYLNENTVIGVGYDRKPVILNINNGITFGSILDKNLANENEKSKSGGIAAARQMFSGKGQKTEDDKFQHQTTITCVNKINDSLISTSDVNGTINFWRI